MLRDCNFHNSIVEKEDIRLRGKRGKEKDED